MEARTWLATSGGMQAKTGAMSSASAATGKPNSSARAGVAMGMQELPSGRSRKEQTAPGRQAATFASCTSVAVRSSM